MYMLEGSGRSKPSSYFSTTAIGYTFQGRKVLRRPCRRLREKRARSLKSGRRRLQQTEF